MKALSRLPELNMSEQVVEGYKSRSLEISLETKINTCKRIVSNDIINYIFEIFPDSKVIFFGMEK